MAPSGGDAWSRRGTSTMLLLLLATSGSVFTTASECSGGREEVLERVARVQLLGVELEPLYQGRHGSSVTMDCINRCRRSATCRGLFLDYPQSSCRALTSTARVEPSAKYRHAPHLPSAYFQKICLHVPASCKSAWAVERIPGYAVDGYDTKVMSDVPNREQCAELCLTATDLRCRSAEYDDRDLQCRLSTEDRRSQPLSFQPVGQHIHYLENQCLEDATKRLLTVKCEYESFENQDLGSWDVEVAAKTQEECTNACSSLRTFRCRGVTWHQKKRLCRLSADDVTGAGGLSALTRARGVTFLQKTPCLDLDLTCSVDAMVVSLRTEEPFQGRLFSQDAPSSCQQLGSGRTDTQLTINFRERDCGVVDEGDGVVSSVVVVQHHPVVQRRGDKAIKLVCLFDTSNRTVSSGYNFQFSGHGLSGGVASAVVNATAPVPRLRLRIVGTDGRDVTGARLGEKLLLQLELDDTSVYGILARNLVARSSDSSGEIVLLDDRGCPVDPLIFPALQPLINGSRGLQGTFQAFKFSEDSVVRFQVNVQFCLQECKPATCTGGSTSYGRRRRRRSQVLLPRGRRQAERSGTATLQLDGQLQQQELRERGAEAAEEEDDDRDTIYHEMPLQKEIIVANTRVIPLINGLLPGEEEFRRMGDLVCTSWEVLVCIIIAGCIVMVCVVLVTIMCVYSHRRHCMSRQDDMSSSTSCSERPTSSAALYKTCSEDSAHTLRVLRTTLRD
uniref:EGF-like domain-containing protein 2 n=1 Tax=Hirondellea gigas TaxID=1518452 RepID=A0A6A7G4W5_9CRUS